MVGANLATSYLFALVICFTELCMVNCGDTPCSFSSDCMCSDDATVNMTVTCANCIQFPQFNTSGQTLTVGKLKVSGTFTNVPAYAVASVQPRLILLTRSGNSSLPLTIDANAFTVPPTNASIPPLELGFSNFLGMTSVPTPSLSKLQLISTLLFENCSLATLDDASLNGVKAQNVYVRNCGLTSVTSKAFANMGTFTELRKFNFEYNKITEASLTAFANVSQMYALYLRGNNIANMTNVAFTCRQLGIINLDSNPIGDTVTKNTFGKLVALQNLKLSNAGMTKVPGQDVLVSIDIVSSLDISHNKITSIPNETFHNFPATSLDYSYNPITVIEPGAFDGMVRDILYVNSLPALREVDAAITKGVESKSTMALMLTDCAQLHKLTCQNIDWLPAQLDLIDVSTNGDVQSVDPNCKNWLTKNKGNSLDISFNKNFTCDASMQWMAPFALCSNPQIKTIDTRCANSSVTVNDYLQTATNYKCNACPVGKSLHQFLIVVIALFFAKFILGF